MNLTVPRRLMAISALGLPGLLGFGGVALAEQSAGGRASLIEEIVVTAQKRQQNIQDVPIAVTAMSGEMVKELGFETVWRLQDQVPNFSMGGLGSTETTPIPYLNIRGIQFTDYAVVNDASVSLYLDEVYQSAPGAGSVQMFDIERIEVLKGPQGSLFGRNTSAGLIQVITRGPTAEPDGYISLQYGEFNQRIVEGAYGAAISDTVRFRVAGKYNEDDGFRPDSPIDNDLDHVGKVDVYALRGTLEADLSNRLLMTVSGHYSESDGIFPGRYRYGTKDPQTFQECDRALILDHQCVTNTGFVVPDDKPTEQYEYVETPSTFESKGGRLKFELQRDWGELVSITGYQEFDFIFRQDTGLGPYSTFNVTGEWDSSVKNFTQEIRVLGSNDRAEWVAGGYYYQDWRDLYNHVFFFYPTDRTIRERDAELDTDSYSFFGQITTDITDTISLSVGGRYTNETRDLKGITDRNNPNFLISDSVDFNNWTGDITLHWKPNDAMLGYVKLSRGAKSGGYNVTGPDLAANGPADEEILDALEVGLKADWLEGRLRTNVAAFYYDFTGFQATAARVDEQGALVGSFFNAGDAEILGAEFEITAIPVENLEIMLGLGLLDGEQQAGPDVRVNGALIDGNDTPQSPSYNLNGLIRYTIPTDSVGSFTLQCDGRYQDDIFFQVDNDPFEIQDAYGVVNFRVFWDSPEGRFRASAFLDNAFEEVYTTGAFYGGGGADHAWREVGAPRRWGIQFQYNIN